MRRRWLAWSGLLACTLGGVLGGCADEARRARATLESQGVAVTVASLEEAAAEGKADRASLLLAAGVDPNQTDSLGRTPLHRAAWAGQRALLDLLLRQGAHVNQTDQLGRTALHVAVSHRALGRESAVDVGAESLLLERGADANAVDHQGLTPLHHAVWTGNVTTSKRLLEAGARPDLLDYEGQTALHLASHHGPMPIVQLLTEWGAPIEKARSDGALPLHLAVLAAPDVAMFYLAKGAHAAVRDEYGSTPLHRAAFNGHTGEAEALLRAGADPNAADQLGRTPLHRLATNPLQMLELLLRHQADPKRADAQGRTLLDVARDLDDPKLIERVRHLVHEQGLSGSGRPGGDLPRPPGRSPGAQVAVQAPGPSPSQAAGKPREVLLAGYRRRLDSMLSHGQLPIIDVHHHYGGYTPIEEVSAVMDETGVALVWLGPNPRAGSQLSLDIARAFPELYVPTICHGQEKPWLDGDRAFLDELHRGASSGSYFALGEFECRHYANQYNDRDVHTPVDSPQMAEVLGLAETYGLPMLLHHEAEDGLLDTLEATLARHPKARVIWCHGGRTRNARTGKRMSQVAYVAGLLERHPNLYFDLVQSVPGDCTLIYDTSCQPPRLMSDWRSLLTRFPDRFLIGTDSNSTRLANYKRTVRIFRESVLGDLPEEAAARIAFKNAWGLMTGQPWP